MHKPVHTWSEAVVDSMVVTTDLLTKSEMEVPRKKEATVSEEKTMTTHTACVNTIEGCYQFILYSRVSRNCAV